MLTFDYLRGSRADVFVASFSGKSDDLAQWSLYGDSFCGVSIGFDHAELERLDRAELRQSLGLAGIEYDINKQDEFFDWLMKRWEQEAAPAIGPVWSDRRIR